jgi:hypothetical protein
MCTSLGLPTLGISVSLSVLGSLGGLSCKVRRDRQTYRGVTRRYSIGTACWPALSRAKYRWETSNLAPLMSDQRLIGAGYTRNRGTIQII